MSSRTQAFVLLLFGVALLRLGSTDLLLRFVRPSARPWVLVAGAAIALLGVWSIVAGARGEEAADAHGHGSASRAAWLVIAPVVAVLVIGPPALGAFSANRESSVVAAGKATESFAPLPAGSSPARLGMFDFAARAVLGGGHTLTGRSVSIVGFVARGSAPDFTLARLTITCCAADASPVFVRVTPTPSGTVVRRNGWVQVTGTYAGVSATDPDVPVLKATAVRAIAAPSNPYD